ncbi:50S ribosomal protein L17 [Desulfurella sp.]|uniref:50S ribosomal protein L17 n=1 Tax=Desulfurella sp. TaxID=1962857 RepID=UPI0025BE82EF|nr:50S ribosomal protein L17 [Desulfurella sp.]
MRHRKAYRTLSIDSDRRKALLRNLAIALIEHGQIKTTDAKAKELQRFISKLVSIGKKNTLSSRRLLLSRLPHKPSVKKLLNDIAPKYIDKNGGYVGIYKIGYRQGDAAKISLIKFQ